MNRLLLLFSFAIAAFGQNAVMLPWTPQQFTNTNGTILVSGKVCTYQAGTSTGLATFTDATATVSNSVPPNAILLDSTARPTSGGIWLTPGKAYKIVTMTAGSDGTCNTGVVVKTQDNVVAAGNTFGLLNGCVYVTGSQTFAQALAAVSNPGCIEVTPGTYSVLANATIPAGVTLRSTSGGVLSVANAVTLTISGPVVAPPNVLFAGAGSVAFTTNAAPYFANWFPGSDIGAQINTAYTALPSTGGLISIAAQNNGAAYNFSTPIVLNTSGKYVSLLGVGSTTVVLNYTPTTATSAILLDYTPAAGQTHKTGHGIRDIQLSNNGCITNGGCGSSATGIQLGQNAAGNGGAEQATISGVEISGFGTGVLYQGVASVGSWGINWIGDTFAYNTTGMNVPVLEERVNVLNSTFITNGTGLSASVGNGTNIILNGDSFDANTTIAISNTSANLWLFANHFENNGTCPITTHYINTTGNLTQIAGDMLDDCSSGGATDYYVTAGGTSAHIYGVQVNSAGRTATAVYVNNTTGMTIEVGNSSPAVLTNLITNNSTRQLQLISSVSLDAISCSEQGVPTGAGGLDFLWCDSSTHRWRTNNNNIGAQTVAYVVAADVSRQSQFVADQGSICTNGELALSAGWQSTGAATVTAVAGNGQTCSWTITTGTTTAANPTVTDTLTTALPAATTVCEMNIHGGTHTPAAGEGFQQTALSATAPIFTFNGTPTAGGTTYFVTRRCGP